MTTKVSREQVVNDLQETAAKVDGILTMDKYREHGKHDVSPNGPIYRLFNGWNNAKEEAGLEILESGERESERDVFYSNEQVKKELEEIIEEHGYISNELVVQEASFSDKIIFYRFKSLENALKELNVPYSSKEELWRNTAEKIINDELYGRFNYRKFRNTYPIKGGGQNYPEFVEWFNQEYSDIQITIGKGGAGSKGRTVFVKNRRIDPYEKYREELPEGTEQLFQDCIDNGYSPKSALTAITYLVTDGTQNEVVESLGELASTKVSLRNARDFIKEELIEDHPNVLESE